MTILYLTFYFKPDLGPGAFRNTSLVRELAEQLTVHDSIHVITTQPNRYDSYKPAAASAEEWRGEGASVTIHRVDVPTHKSGLTGQVKAFWVYFRAVLRLTQTRQYTSVFASSSRLFTAFLGARLARRQSIPLSLDIRDLFREAILDVLNRPMLGLVLNPFLQVVERYAFGYASHINLISEGFRDYFRPYKQATYSFFTNGIDDAFLHFPVSKPIASGSVKTILYAGNIGEGQRLDTIIPETARQLGSGYCFVVIGDGSARLKLEAQIRLLNLTNVTIRPPVNRQALLTEYQRADYLFLHLSNVPACQRVLPSKLFEYGATDKPILAGVTGYAASFVRENLPNALVFSPGDSDSLVSQISETPYQTRFRTAFVRQFQRAVINQDMARQLCQYAHSATHPDDVVHTLPARTFRSVLSLFR